MSQLPSNWVECLIGDVTRIVAGGTPPSKDASNFTVEDAGIPWVTPADLSEYKQIYISRGARNLTEKGFSECSAIKMPAGSVLFSSRAPIGYVAIAANEVSTNQGFKSFVLPDGLNGHFIYYYLKYIKPVAEEMATGTTFKELSGATTAKVPLIVAPSNEQKRIADKLDVLLARVDICSERLYRVPLILKRFRQSVLTTATSGELTADWRAKRDLAEWADSTIGESSLLVTKGASPKWQGINYVDDPRQTLFVTSENVGQGQMLLRVRKYVENEFNKKQKRSVLKRGDVLTNIVGASIGRSAIFDLENVANINQAVCVIRVDDTKLINIFLMYYLNSPQGVSDILGGAVEVARANVSLATISSLAIKLPSIEEQHEIVRRVEALFAYANRLEARYQSARAQVEKLTPALLAKAFRGELVPQDPNDEPARVLIDRIHTARATASATPKTRKPRMSKQPGVPKEIVAMSKSRFDDDVKGQPYLAKLLRTANTPLAVEHLFSQSELPLVDFYKQLAWEVEHAMIRDNTTKLEAV